MQNIYFVFFFVYNKYGDAMKKIIFIFMLMMSILFVNMTFVYAEKKSYDFGGETYTFDDEKEGLYCGKQAGFYGLKDFNACITIYKTEKEFQESTKQYIINTSATYDNGSERIKLITTENDPVVNSDDLWWKSLRYCNTFSSSVPVFGIKASGIIFTDYLSSNIRENDNIAANKCVSLTVREVADDKTVYTCGKITDGYLEISSLASDYKSSKKPYYLTKYKQKVEEMRNLCTQSLKNGDYNDACVQLCMDLEDTIYETNKTFEIEDSGECGFSERLIAFILNVLKWIKYIIPVVVIILGSLDFIKATSSDKDDDVKKAQSNFVRRLIAAALIFLIPLIIEFILPKFGFDYYSCGLF